ncbi:hypothetical protein [uncultured Ruminococcus sp.]|uniref:hypothetical protein n=1 Tax=uncultured Ruminococcus sp. TaxID=165186 RepID=UPI0025EC6748|nr:hypothetical protein [uncultured Ruminococcus sp.]
MYYIKCIKIHTQNGVTSTLPLCDGMNVIYGPSNTGKSLVLDCIDFIMGSKGKNENKKNEESISYKRLSKPELKIEKIALCLDVDGKEILISRCIDSNDINVSSNVSYIESGTYAIGKGSKKKPPINHVWLRIIGILDDDIKIAQKADGSPQGLTWRTFLHTFLINETRIVGENSIFKNGQGYQKNIPIPTVSSLIYLATGKSFAIKDSKDEMSDAVVTAKKSTAKLMYDRSIEALAEENFVNIIEVDDNRSVAEISEDIDELLTQIAAAEDVLEQAVEENHTLAMSISDLDNQLAECSMLKDRYASLRTQYESDVRRLTFIAEGDMYRKTITTIEHCPFCNGILKKEQSKSCLEAAIYEVKKIELKINDLRAADGDINRETEELNHKRDSLVTERKKVQSLIRGDLQPRVDELRDKMISYTAALEKAKAKEMVEAFAQILQEQLEAITSNNDEAAQKNSNFNITSQINEYITSPLSKHLETLLKECNYDNFVGARFDETLCDVVVNGSDKMSQGKGFRAFLNAVMAIALQEWLADYDLYQPHLLVMDSPILSLKEKEENIGTEVTTDGMRSGLFKYMVEHQKNRQTIILENEIPNIEYSNVNLIHFTKIEGNGLYGLVTEYRE